MKTINSRIEKLEAAAPALPGEPFDLSAVLGKIEAGAGLPAGSLPRTTDQAAALGFESMAEATAAALGITIQELKAGMKA